MDFLYIWILPVVGGLIYYALTSAFVKAPGTMLNQKFVNLGTLKGKTLQEITDVAGSPSAISVMGDGTKLYQWQATSYHIALIFDENDICLGVSSEISV